VLDLSRHVMLIRVKDESALCMTTECDARDDSGHTSSHNL